MSNKSAPRKMAAKFRTVITPSGAEKRIPYEFTTGAIQLEEEIEEILERNFGALELDAALIGCQVLVHGQKKMDLFGVNRKGQLCIVELKRDTAERIVFIQIIDYARRVSGFLSDQINQMCKSAKPSASSLSDIYHDHFKEELPEKRTRNPLLVIVAEDFEESEIEMALYLNQEHHFCIRLISYEAKRHEAELSLTLQHEVLPDDQLRVTSKIPAQVLEVRVTESDETLWDHCHDEQFIPNTPTILNGIQSLNLAEPIWLLIYLDKHGYVAFGRIEDLENLEADSAGRYFPLKMKWEYSVEREQAVFDGESGQPEDVQKLLDEDKWSLIVGRLRFKAERKRRSKTKKKRVKLPSLRKAMTKKK